MLYRKYVRFFMLGMGVMITACGGGDKPLPTEPATPPPTQPPVVPPPPAPNPIVYDIAFLGAEKMAPVPGGFIYKLSARGSINTDPKHKGFKWRVKDTLITAQGGDSSTIVVTLLYGINPICVQLEASLVPCQDPPLVVEAPPPPPIVVTGQIFVVTSPTNTRVGSSLDVCANKTTCVSTEGNGKYQLSGTFTSDNQAVIGVKCPALNPNCGILPADTVVSKADFAKPQIFTTVASTWTIQSGEWQGVTLPVSMAEARAQAKGGYNFYYQALPVITWPKAKWPIPVKFSTTGSDPLTPQEIAAALASIQATLDPLNAQRGQRMVRLATLSDQISLLPDSSASGGIVVNANSSIDNDGASLFYKGDSLTGCRIWLKRVPLSEQFYMRTTAHEITHCFGVGHFSRSVWGVQGLMGDDNYSNDPNYGKLVAKEVMYLDINDAVAESRRTNGGHGIGSIERPTFTSTLATLKASTIGGDTSSFTFIDR